MNSSIQFGIWFQPEVPYPAVDLQKLKPKEEDAYPPEIEKDVKNGKLK